jgi:alkylation response protein AidB-like acyl-CoA dehydrogenase
MTNLMSEIQSLEIEFESWLLANMPDKPDFTVPETFMEVGSQQQMDWLIEWQCTLLAAGYIGMSWPLEYGGQGKTHAHQAVIDDVLAKHRAPIVVNTIGLNWAGPLIMDVGSDEQKKRYIPKILNGEDIWCQGFSEPAAGGDLAGIACKAERDGDEYVINGSKIWTTHGAFAKHMILLARTGESGEGRQRFAGMSFFLAPMTVAGIDPRPIEKLTHEHGFCQTFFDNARIPAETMIGGEGNGWKMAMLTLTYERAVTGGQGAGYSLSPLPATMLIELAKDIERDGAPALKDPAIRDELVQLLIEQRALDLTRGMGIISALVQERPMSLGLSSKLRFTELRRKVGHFGITLQGANGGLFMGDDEAISGGYWQRAYMNSFSATIGGGPSQIQSNIIAERVLGLPKD